MYLPFGGPSCTLHTNTSSFFYLLYEIYVVYAEIFYDKSFIIIYLSVWSDVPLRMTEKVKLNVD